MSENGCGTLDLLFYISMAFLVAKNTSIICLMGVGLGFGLTSWIIYKVYHRSRQKYPENLDDDEEDLKLERSLSSNGLKALNMGNNTSLRVSAGINFDEDQTSQTGSGVRHRNATSKHICASIVEDESGAYISRAAFQNSDISLPCVTSNPIPDASFATLSSMQSGPQAPVPVQSLGANTLMVTSDISALSMNDSGYLDTDNCSSTATSSRTVSNADSILEPIPQELNEGYECRQTLNQAYSDISSLSDKQMRDLGLDTTLSDLSSCRSSYGPDSDQNIEEEVLQIELEDQMDDTIISHCMDSTQTLLGCSLGNHACYESAICPPDTTLALGSSKNVCSSDEDPETSRHSNSSCTLHSQSPLSYTIENSDTSGSRPSSVISSPLLTVRSGHSRSSSITSADIDLETTSCSNNEAMNDIEKMELELNEIRREIEDVEGRLTGLMCVDTTQLYFNVDGMKKLTEVVMSSDDINLTTSEIAKAFQILRKYRYTFMTPEKKAPFGHNEAESMSMQTPVADKSLPYLDLADSLSSQHRHKRRSVVDWVDGLDIPIAQEIAFQIPDDDEVVTEMDTELYGRSHPLFSQGYAKLAEDEEFSKIYLVNAHEHAGLIAAYCAKIIQGSYPQTGEDEPNIDSISETLEDLVMTSHSYLQTWQLGHITQSTDTLATMKLSARMMIQQSNSLRAISDKQERISSVLAMFNQAANSRALIVEGIRVLTFLKVNELYQRYIRGDELPLHGWMLFARESSSNPRYYFTNHIQNGTTRELEQVDLSLLADVLGITIQVFSPLEVNSTSFHHIYPENDLDHKQSVSLAVHSSSSYAVLS